MNDLGRAFTQATREVCSTAKYRAKTIIHGLAGFVVTVLPLAAVLLGEYVGAQRGGVYFGGEVLLVLALQVVAIYAKKVMSKMGCGDEVPVPAKRFTSVDPYGEVSVSVDRTQELILYVADVEDYLERTGRMDG